MIISLQNQELTPSYNISENGFEVDFSDPSYVRSDMLIVHGSNLSLGVVLHEAYIDFGALPQNISVDVLKAFKKVTLTSTLPNGEVFRLQAPLHFK